MTKFTQRKWFTFLILLLLLLNFSCSDDFNNQPDQSNLQNEDYFVELVEARQIAEEMLFDKEKPSGKGINDFTVVAEPKTVEMIATIKNESLDKASFYVVNYQEDGFIILSADKRANPILAYADKGSFIIDEEEYPDGLKDWMEETKTYISELRTSEIKQSSDVQLAWERSNKLMSRIDPEPCYDHSETVQVGPLLSTTWYQTGVFNDALPYITCNGYSQQVYAGCVPIAMAQVMKYFEYPTSYNWSAMPPDYATTTTANFIEDIHEAIDSQYSGYPTYDCDGTGVISSANMGNVLKNEFGYSTANWAGFSYNTVKSSLNSNKPVILSGSNGSVGHMWVCDGYSQLYVYREDCTGLVYIPVFHMNWGWHGSYDGYYSYNDFTPGSHNYNSNKKMIYNITP
ncbi:C10 family peptidase [Neptunitalea lumnitzerae]|uniref:Spi protease inhibitor domain-containing protein n=1 Tax=Neptunitalea lumnitzerae TaxID=2965509 RepID=A0ABQ5MIW4_9FLAO|nr:C10 family peptidase [Neptunitalea sp. Y10]GLB49350.1 hypothetical protein Y10_17180 [Neptunitalea sp. Y10]